MSAPEEYRLTAVRGAILAAALVGAFAGAQRANGTFVGLGVGIALLALVSLIVERPRRRRYESAAAHACRVLREHGIQAEPRGPSAVAFEGRIWRLEATSDAAAVDALVGASNVGARP